MKIGFVTIYAWRPHVEQAVYISKLLKNAGHTTHFLTCDSDLPACYTRQLRNRSNWRECLECRIGGFRSYERDNIDSLGDLSKKDDSRSQKEWAYSSASTLGRFESNDDFEGPQFQELVENLVETVEISYRATRAWIKKYDLDAVFIFNGRMDATRGIFEGAKSLGTRVISMERTWFGDGLQLYPEETCLGLSSVHRLVSDWKNKPLTRKQAIQAASYGAKRFLKLNTTEWRAYNLNSKNAVWNSRTENKILIIPSSRNEIWGHKCWDNDWPNITDGFDELIAKLNAHPSDVLLRCHPNWSEKIGLNTGINSEKYYIEWAKLRGIPYLSSSDPTSTLQLIDMATAVVVSVGSAALEAGMLGKQIFSLSPSVYSSAGFTDNCFSPGDMEDLVLHKTLSNDEINERQLDIKRKTLRFAYTMMHRIPQFVSEVKSIKTTEFLYDLDADQTKLVDLIISGILMPDDDTYANNLEDEDQVLDLVSQREWETLLNGVATEDRVYKKINRKMIYRPIDFLRNLFPHGDR